MITEYKIVPIDRFPGYFIDNEGFVWSERGTTGRNAKISESRSKIRRLIGTRHPSGYYYLGLSINNKQRNRYIHRLVLEAFVGPCPEKMQTRHLNGIKGDNRLENLKWGTPKENGTDKIRHGMNIRGEEHGLSVLTEQEVLEVYRLRGIETQRSLANRFGVSVTTISSIWNKKSWKHIHDSSSGIESPDFSA